MIGRARQATVPLYALLVGVVLQIVAGAIGFLTDVPLVALVLCVVGLVCLGAAGDALRKGAAEDVA